MRYRIEYYNGRILKDIESWPVGILADYARLVELLMEFGPALGMPHSRAMACLNSELEDAKASAARYTAT